MTIGGSVSSMAKRDFSLPITFRLRNEAANSAA